MATKGGKKPSNAPTRPAQSWWDALKVVALKALGKGHVPFATLCLTFLGAVFLWKVESADIVKIAEVFANSPIYTAAGWLLAVLVFAVSRLQQIMYRRDIERITLERNNLQANAIPVIKSSNHLPTLIGKDSDHEH